MFKENPIVAIIGLGYVGLPLALAFDRKHKTIAFDIKTSRIDELSAGNDSTLEVDSDVLQAANIQLSSDENDLKAADIYIVTVPTPIDEHKQPDLRPLKGASTLLGGIIEKGNIVIYESTVYPGATEEVCLPIIEEISSLKLNQDFFAGYSPERISPGDKQHQLTDIKKVTSGSTVECANYIDDLYASIISAGTHRASSIRVAEASKVIENTQRDLNIALINELAIIFDRLDIETEEVLLAAGSKWNFLPFRPGLVGGHCIGVDPYYLTHKAQETGYHPEVILAGRRINDGMGQYIVSQLVKEMILRGMEIKSANILVMGLAFKEDISDIRNSKAVDIVTEAKAYGVNVDVYDPYVNVEDAQDLYGISPVDEIATGSYHAIILAVAHSEFLNLGIDKIRSYGQDNAILFDIKYMFPAEQTDLRL